MPYVCDNILKIFEFANGSRLPSQKVIAIIPNCVT